MHFLHCLIGRIVQDTTDRLLALAMQCTRCCARRVNYLCLELSRCLLACEREDIFFGELSQWKNILLHFLGRLHDFNFHFCSKLDFILKLKQINILP